MGIKVTGLSITESCRILIKLWGEFMSSYAAHKLSAFFIKPGKYSDQLGLYLIVEPRGANAGNNALRLKGNVVNWA